MSSLFLNLSNIGTALWNIRGYLREFMHERCLNSWKATWIFGSLKQRISYRAMIVTTIIIHIKRAIFGLHWMIKKKILMFSNLILLLIIFTLIMITAFEVAANRGVTVSPMLDVGPGNANVDNAVGVRVHNTDTLLYFDASRYTEVFFPRFFLGSKRWRYSQSLLWS